VAQDAVPQPCAPTETVTLASIDPQGELLLEDGRRLRLAGLDLTAPPPGEGDWPGFLARLTRAARLRVAPVGSADRWGRFAVQLHVGPVESGGEAWLQDFLLRIGAARLKLDETDPTCLKALRAAESAARTARLGLWAAEDAVLQASAVDKLLTNRGKAAMVEGRVVDLGQTAAVFYLNFGHARHKDVSVLIPKRLVKRFDTAGLAPSSLVGRRLRVRGIVEGRSAPRIEATRPEQIEIVE